MRRTAITAVVAMSMTSYAVGQEKSIDDFKTGKITLKTTLTEFRRLYPDAEVVKAEAGETKANAKTYLTTKVEGPTFIMVKFFDETVCFIAIQWDEREIDKVGGSKRLLEKVIRIYGKADADSPGVVNHTPFKYKVRWDGEDDGTQMQVRIEENRNGVEEMSLTLFPKKVNRARVDRQTKNAKSGIDD